MLWLMKDKLCKNRIDPRPKGEVSGSL